MAVLKRGGSCDAVARAVGEQGIAVAYKFFAFADEFKQVGQAVKGGETIATVGNSGGNPESGLYFELRHKGQPIDPMKWASLK